MRILFFIIILVSALNYVLALSNLDITNVNYNELYSNSLSEIIVSVTNSGDEMAILSSSTIFGFENYNTYSAPRFIDVGVTEEVVFNVNIPCRVKNSIIPFSVNFTFSDSGGIRSLNSSVYNAVVRNGISVRLLSPSSLDNLQSIKSDSFLKLSYMLENPGLEQSSIIINVTSENFVYSDILSFTGEYSASNINKVLFYLQPKQSYLFSHVIRPTISGSSGEYVITISDQFCEYNREYLILKYQTISSSQGIGFDIQVADEGDYLFILIPIFFLLCCQKILFQE